MSKLLIFPFTKFLNENELIYRNDIQPYEEKYNQEKK